MYLWFSASLDLLCLCSVSHPSANAKLRLCDQEIWIGFGSVHPALKPQNMHMFPCRPVHDLTLSTPKELDVQTPILYAQAGPGRRVKRPSVSTLVALWSPLACPSCPFYQSSQKWGHGFLQSRLSQTPGSSALPNPVGKDAWSALSYRCRHSKESDEALAQPCPCLLKGVNWTHLSCFCSHKSRRFGKLPLQRARDAGSD